MNADVYDTLTMVVEQTRSYARRMEYDPQEKTFHETEYESLMHRREFDYPYGWVKESGTPPLPHCDCILMSDRDYELGDEVSIKIIGMFKRNDGDHKYVVVETARQENDISLLSQTETDALHRLYPHVGEGEGWFGREEALYSYLTCEKAL